MKNYDRKGLKNFDISPTTRRTIYKLRDRLVLTGFIWSAPKNGWPISFTTHENEMLVDLAFTQSSPPPTRCLRCLMQLKVWKWLLHGLLNTIQMLRKRKAEKFFILSYVKCMLKHYPFLVFFLKLSLWIIKEYKLI